MFSVLFRIRFYHVLLVRPVHKVPQNQQQPQNLFLVDRPRPIAIVIFFRSISIVHTYWAASSLCPCSCSDSRRSYVRMYVCMYVRVCTTCVRRSVCLSVCLSICTYRLQCNWGHACAVAAAAEEGRKEGTDERERRLYVVSTQLAFSPAKFMYFWLWMTC